MRERHVISLGHCREEIAGERSYSSRSHAFLIGTSRRMRGKPQIVAPTAGHRGGRREDRGPIGQREGLELPIQRREQSADLIGECRRIDPLKAQFSERAR